MSVDFKDYYAVLGLNRNASSEGIKKAFRRLARQHHPDIAKNKVGAEERFKEINEANEVLSDPEKRRKYDDLGADWNQPERQKPSPGGFAGAGTEGPEVHFSGTGYSDFFEQFFAGGNRRDGDFTAHGHNGAGREAAAQHGRDVESDIVVTLNEVLQGSTRMIQMQRADSQNGQPRRQTLRLKILAGVREGQMIRVAGNGEEGFDGGQPGNLYLRVKFAKHPDFQVRNANLYFDLELAPWEAVLGASVQIPTLDGAVSLKIPPCTLAEREFRLRGKGLPSGKGPRGDLHAVVRIQVPPQLTSEERVLWEKLAAESHFNPRNNS